MTTPAKFRKKPVVIEAEQYGHERTLSAAFVASAPPFTFKYTEEGTLLIQTLEGVMEAKNGDWIIKGIKGEFYPCKPDIFAATYESATPQPAGREEEEAKRLLGPCPAILGAEEWWSQKAAAIASALSRARSEGATELRKLCYEALITAASVGEIKFGTCVLSRAAAQRIDAALSALRAKDGG